MLFQSGERTATSEADPLGELVVLLELVTLPSIKHPRRARDAQHCQIILSDGSTACCYERHLCPIQEEP